MKILFIHQNFPGQYLHLAAALAADPGNEVVAIGEQRNVTRRPQPHGVNLHTYAAIPDPSPHTHHYLRDFENAVRRGQAVARLALTLRRRGFVPDVICAHPAWGEALYLKDVYPQSTLLAYAEFYYHAQGADCGFDAEYPAGFDDALRLRTRNAAQLVSLETCDRAISPTEWQKRQYPELIRARISVMHDGIDTHRVSPDPQATVTLPQIGLTLTPQDEIITYAARNLEPYRGFHSFMRSLPHILRARPRAQVLIVGGNEVSYGRKPPQGATYRSQMLEEIGADIDHKRVHFLGRISYATFLQTLRVSSAHVYLTYPFVLSWSMLEAMAAGCVVIGSRTPPVQEVIQDGQNGLLVNFFSPQNIAECVNEVLEHPDRMQSLRAAARRTIQERYDLRAVCLPKQIDLIHHLSGSPPHFPRLRIRRRHRAQSTQ
jgi:glycosyltransferase involved in cell wall biosynthesis